MKILAVLLITLTLCQCMSLTAPKLGMSEKTWLRTTLVGDIAMIDGDLRVYRSGGAFYYFKAGKLVKVDQGQSMPHTLNVNVKSS